MSYYFEYDIGHSPLLPIASNIYMPLNGLVILQTSRPNNGNAGRNVYHIARHETITLFIHSLETLNQSTKFLWSWSKVWDMGWPKCEPSACRGGGGRTTPPSPGYGLEVFAWKLIPYSLDECCIFPYRTGMNIVCQFYFILFSFWPIHIFYTDTEHTDYIIIILYTAFFVLR